MGDLAKALDSALVQAVRSPGLTADGVVVIFDHVEQKFLPRVAGDAALTLETKRRVAERKLCALMERKLPYESVSPHLDALYVLGFTTIEIQASIEIIFARYCLRQGRKDEARDVLQKLRGDIDQALKVRNLVYLREIRQKVETLLGEIGQ